MERLVKDIKAHRNLLYLSLVATFFWGMAGHGYMFTNNAVSHDSLREFHAEILGNNIKIGSGRIFTPIYRELLGSDVTLPWFMGIIALLWIGLAVFLVLRVFDVRSKLSACLIAGVFSTNIAVSATTATYIHDLDSYMFSMLCAVAAVYFWKQLRFGWLLGSVFVAGSLGIYQGYLFLTVTLVMIDCIFRLMGEDDFRTVFIRGLKADCMILLGGILYYAVMKGMTALSGIKLTKGDYNSMDLILHQPLRTMISLVGGAYLDCFQRIWNAYSSYPSILIKGITLVFLMICAVSVAAGLIGNRKGLKEWGLCFVLIALLPLGMNMIYVLVIGRSHDLMTFPVWMFYLLVILAADRLADRCHGLVIQAENPGQWLRNGMILLMILLLYGNVRFSNGLYMKKDLEYDAYLSLMSRVAARMEAEGDYLPGETPVVFVGTPKHLNGMIPGFKDYWNVIGMMQSDLLIMPERSRYQAYFDYVMGLPIKLAEQNVWDSVSSSEIAKNMPCYPEQGSVALYNEMLIVKLGQFSETKRDFYKIPD